MTKPAISVEHLSKSYRIGKIGQGKLRRQATFREALFNALFAPYLRLRGGGEAARDQEIFWALKDVSFDVQPGEVVGIIGRNGAGKSTLLKILSQITEPTQGRVLIRGRVASLLEVGTGFHPDLTGRENVFLSGAILGMKRAEIRRKFEEIVAFSEIEKFIDTPVKRYSSGMYVRLAFAVAAHLEPEILILDEVLAVGDAEFQKKCLAKMHEIVSTQGRTVLLVSHNLHTIAEMCQRVVLLRSGTIAAFGDAAETIESYLAGLRQLSILPLAERTDRGGVGGARLVGLSFESDADGHACMLTCGKARIRFECEHLPAQVHCSFTVFDTRGYPVAHFDSADAGPEDTAGRVGSAFVWETASLPLAPGRYRINVSLHRGAMVYDHIEGAADFEVLRAPVEGRTMTHATGLGSLAVAHRWHGPAIGSL
jgi:lipopolysaccharide transport system ATP-binding protein